MLRGECPQPWRSRERRPRHRPECGSASPRRPVPQSRRRRPGRGLTTPEPINGRIGGMTPSCHCGSAPHAHAHIIGHVAPMGYGQYGNRTARMTLDHAGPSRDTPTDLARWRIPSGRRGRPTAGPPATRAGRWPTTDRPAGRKAVGDHP
ncbi:conserved hypothetical protein [Frankia sp. AgKG'84/4]